MRTLNPVTPDSISRSCVVALPRDGGAGLLLAGAGQDQLERMLIKLGIAPKSCWLGQAHLQAVLPEFLPREEPLPEDADLDDRVVPGCLMARLFDGSPPILLMGGTQGELAWILRRLGYPLGTYALAGARLADCVLVEGWEVVHERRF